MQVSKKLIELCFIKLIPLKILFLKKKIGRAKKLLRVLIQFSYFQKKLISMLLNNVSVVITDNPILKVFQSIEKNTKKESKEIHESLCRYFSTSIRPA